MPLLLARLTLTLDCSAESPLPNPAFLLVGVQPKLLKEILFLYFFEGSWLKRSQGQVFNRNADKAEATVPHGIHHFSHLSKLSFRKGD